LNIEVNLIQSISKLKIRKKNTDLKLTKELITGLDYFRTIRLKKKLEAYVNYLSSFLAKVISASVLL
jgi:hypothetical protein